MLELKFKNVVIGTAAEGSWVRLPNGDQVSPATDGWSNDDGYSLRAIPDPKPEPEPTPDEVLAAWRAGAFISFPQLLIGLVKEGWITEAEGYAWNAKVLPDAVTAVIATLPQEMRFAATTRALNPSQVDRSNPLVSAIGAAAGKTEADLDAFFQTYALV